MWNGTKNKNTINSDANYLYFALLHIHNYDLSLFIPSVEISKNISEFLDFSL